MIFCLTTQKVIAMTINNMQESCIMKKRFLVAAMAAAMVSPIAAHANATVYGNVHLSINDFDSADNLDMTSNTSSIGVKGKEDLGGGVSAIYKVEFQVDPSERNQNITDRDQWVGLKSAMGTVKFGTMSSNYKQMGGKVDPMYRTRLEGRGFMGIQTSTLHGGAGESRGRMTNTIQYASPKMGGLQAVFNTTVSGNDDETMGLGIRYVQKGVMAYFDYIDTAAMQVANADAAMKIGGKYKMDALVIGAQFEMVEDSIATDDVFFLSADYQLNDSDNVAFTFGDNGADDAGFAFMYNHDMSNRTNVYAGYGDNASSTDADDDQVLTFGLRHKF
jgi:predicted porin